MDTNKIEFHEAANIFPMITGDEFEQLASDIKKNGLRESIKKLDGKIIDGRNRFVACNQVDVSAVFEDVQTDDPVQYVLSLNLHRRHLTPSQASMCAARAREIYERQADKRRRAGVKIDLPENLPEGKKGESRNIAGKAFGVSGKSVDHAKKVIERGTPELVKAVDEGRMAVSTAAVLASEPPEEQKAAIESQAKRNYAKMAGRNKNVVEPKPPTNPRHPGEHNQTELFAINKAEVAITQLKGIPVSNVHRDAAMEHVINWINSQRKRK